MLIRKKTFILDGVCFNYEQLYHPVQCTVCRICQYSSRDKLVAPEVTGILSIPDQFLYVSVTVHDNIQLVCISLEVYTYFSPTIIYCPF